jgi:adenine phosphoribosyltransferase
MDDRAVQLQRYIRTIPDFPKPGIDFRDITSLIADASGFAMCVDMLVERATIYKPDVLVAVEARGFIFGAAMAVKMGLGMIPVRKRGKLPGATIGIDYALEYGEDRLELHADALSPGHVALLIDDLLATGGTILAAAELVRSTGAIVPAALFVIDLPDLGGSAKLASAGLACETLIAFTGH